MQRNGGIGDGGLDLPSGHRDRKLLPGAGKEIGPSFIGLGRLRGNGQRYLVSGFSREADFRADQPGRKGPDVDRTAGLQVGRRRDFHEQERLAFVPVAGQDVEFDLLGIGPVDFSGLESIGQRPVNLRGQARIGRVAPVGVPVLVHLHPQAGPERLPGLDGRRLHDQFGFHVIGTDRLTVDGPGAGAEGEQDRERQ